MPDYDPDCTCPDCCEVRRQEFVEDLAKHLEGCGWHWTEAQNIAEEALARADQIRPGWERETDK